MVGIIAYLNVSLVSLPFVIFRIGYDMRIKSTPNDLMAMTSSEELSSMSALMSQAINRIETSFVNDLITLDMKYDQNWLSLYIVLSDENQEFFALMSGYIVLDKIKKGLINVSSFSRVERS